MRVVATPQDPMLLQDMKSPILLSQCGLTAQEITFRKYQELFEESEKRV